jgi:osomolarity two-component system phosphorelay intermediate protein YPD1
MTPHFSSSDDKDLPQLSSLGHFLKGSSAALGVIKVQAACEKIQHYGHKRDEEAGESLEDDEALKRIDVLLKECRKSYVVAKGWLTRLYEEEGAAPAA